MDETRARRRHALLVASTGLLLATNAARAEYVVKRVATGLDQPTYMTQAPGDNTTLYVTERKGLNGTLGQIVTYNPITNTKSLFLNVGGSAVQDGGILGMTFHPDYQTNGKFYVTSLVGSQNRLDEYTKTGDTISAPRTVLAYTNDATQHTINWVGFKPNPTGAARNELYVSMGDGGIQANQANFQNNGQNLNTVKGKVLRLDVSFGADAYPSDANKNFGIVPTNPYANDGDANTLGEIFVSGLRNPWHLSFDRSTSDLYIGDVGFDTVEEVNFVKAGTSGQDFGWSNREGTIAQPNVGGAKGNSLDPILQLPHNSANSITAGYMYRGPIAELQGKFFAADFVNNKIWSFNFDPNTPTSEFDGSAVTNFQDVTSAINGLIPAGGGGPIRAIVSFAEDNVGNVYIISFGATGNAFNPDFGSGEIYQLALVPEPTSIALLAGSVSMLLRRRRANRK